MPFRVGAVDGRAVVVVGEQVYDVQRASDGELGAEVIELIANSSVLSDLSLRLAAADADEARAASLVGSVAEVNFGAPIAIPGSCFAVGLNYRLHVEESGLDLPEAPVVFTKFPSCIAGPNSVVALNSEHADYEVELVVVIGTGGADIAAADAWDHIAGLTVGNDISDRQLQFAAKPPHFSLGKSRRGYGPIGPVIVSLDSFDDPADLELSCTVNDDERQRDRTTNLIFDIPFLVEYLSAIVTLKPGDLIFTGTPSGVGGPTGSFLTSGDRVVCSVEGIGSIETECR